MTERLQKILARWGVGSRRRSEELIRTGQIFVNGDVAELGMQVDPEQDRIEYQGRLLNPAAPPVPVYLLLHKPAGVVSTCADPQGRRTVLAILPPQWSQIPGLHPVGRLDYETTGALILTNDGNLTYQLTHPRHHCPKTYQAWVKGIPSATVLRQWESGVNLDGQMTLPARVQILKHSTRQEAQTLLEIVIVEGRNRQIRRVAKQLGYPVLQLHRVAIGPISLRSENSQTPLQAGQVRILQPHEIAALKHNRYNPDESRTVNFCYR